MPPPTGVVSGPLMATRNSRIAATVSSGSQVSNFALAFSPAKTSYQAMRRLLLYAFSTAASKTRAEAFQISRPVPSPSMKGMIGRSGTRYLPLLYSIFCPLDGTGTPLNDAMRLASRRLGRNPVIIRNIRMGDARLAITGRCDDPHGEVFLLP